MKQIEFLEKAIRLQKEHPEAGIHVCVDNELAEEWGWTAHNIYKVEFGLWFIDCERILTDSKEVQDLLSDRLDREVSEEEAVEEMEPAVLIFTKA